MSGLVEHLSRNRRRALLVEPGAASVGERGFDRAVVNVGSVVNQTSVPGSLHVGPGLCSLPVATGNVGCWPQPRWSVAEVALVEAVLARSRREVALERCDASSSDGEASS